MRDLAPLIPDAIALAVCAAAVATDLRAPRIPNRITVPALIAGLTINAVLGGLLGGPSAAGYALLFACGGALVGLVVFGVPAGFGLVGMGDVKLAMVVGALVRWPLAVPLALYAAIAGGMLAIGYAIHRGRVRAVAHNIATLGSTRRAELHRMPYALAIVVGCIIAVASRHL